MQKITVMGEALLRLLTEEPLDKAEQYQASCGGTALEAACTIARLGGECSLLACVGEDPFGRHVLDWLKQQGVDTAQMQQTGQAATTLCFVQHGVNPYYPATGADRMLAASHLQEILLAESGILHFTSEGLADAPCRFAHQRAIRVLRQQGGLLSFALRYHLALWDSPAAWQAAMRAFLPFADVVTAGEESLMLLTGCEDAASAHRQLLAGSCQLICCLSRQGVRLTNQHGTAMLTTELPVSEPEAAGALLYCIAQEKLQGVLLQELSRKELHRLGECAVRDAKRR